MKKCRGFVLPLTAVLLFASTLTTTVFILEALQQHREHLFHCRHKILQTLEKSKALSREHQGVPCEATAGASRLKLKPDRSFLK